MTLDERADMRSERFDCSGNDNDGGGLRDGYTCSGQSEVLDHANMNQKV